MANVVDAIWNLLFKPGEQEKYQENPAEYAAETGLDQCDPAELYEAVVMAYEKGPVYQGASVNVGGNQGVGGSSQSAGPGPAPSAPPPPPPLDPTLPPAEALEQTINYYISNTTTTNVDDRDTNVDSSVNTNILAEEGSTVGPIDIDNETNTASGDAAVAAGDDVTGVATGAGAVAAGDDINAPVNTGTVEDSILADESNFDDTVIGDDNQAIQDSTAVIGSGTASNDDVDVDINASGGDVDLENVNFGKDNTIDDSEQFTEQITDSFNATTEIVDDSFNEQSQVGDDSFDGQLVQDSFNEPPVEEAAAEAPAEDLPEV